MRRKLRIALVVVGALYGARAFAQDVWTEPVPGVRYLHRSTPEPKEIHALLVDLSRPEISLRATRENESGRTTSSFSNLVGAVAAINGDFYNTNGSFDPVGLAVGEGMIWSTDSVGHRFLACSAVKECEIDTTNQARSADASWVSAVGGNVLLVNEGAVVQSESDDTACGSFCTVPHPRTAAGLSADGLTLILVVVEGRQTPLLGMSLSRLAELMLELGASVALNLDGGGSSAMVVSGARVSGRPSNEPSERSVANHLAVLHDPSAATTGRLVGFIREEDIFDDTAGLAGATVSLSSGERTTTDDLGHYAFDEVAPGDVTVNVVLDGFLPASDIKTVVAGITNWKSIAMIRGTPDAGVDVPEEDASIDGGGVVDGGETDAGQDQVPSDGGVPQDAGAVAANDEVQKSRCVCTGGAGTGWGLLPVLVVLGLRRRTGSSR